MRLLLLAALAGPVPSRYIALGDSFTAGTGSSPEQSFPMLLAATWRLPVDDLGVNGFTTDDLIAFELPQLARLHPTFVTLAIGANDIVRSRSAADYRRNLQTIFAALARLGLRGSRLVALPQPDWSLSPAAAQLGSPAQLARQIVAFNGILREETLRAGGQFVDLFPLMQRQARAGALAPDGLHPSALAYAEWAKALADALPHP